MAHRITVASKVPDARARSYFNTLRTLFPRTRLNAIVVAQAYTIDARLSSAERARVAECLTSSTIEQSSTSTVLAPKTYAYTVEIGYHPGVTDNVGNTARETIEDALGRKMKEADGVYSSVFLFLGGNVAKRDVEQMAAQLHNPLIEHARILSFKEAKRGIPIVVPKVRLRARSNADYVNLTVDDAELVAIGKQGIRDRDGTRRGPLALSLQAMRVIRDHFKKEKRKPTDIELESLAQTWSEHCKHSIFADSLDEVQEGIYRRYIKGATQKIRKEKGKKDFCVSVFTDNSGAIAFDDEYLVTHKVETHNSPSALDPFGGAITGIVGVNRDALGFGLGAKPIANVYGFCVADPRDNIDLYRDESKTQPLLPARRILEGVVKGVNAGGNQSGIPTPLGFVAVDPRYRGKPLVFAGTVGLIPRKARGKRLYEKSARPGDYVVMIGGRVGLDGIHGATFSSEALASGSPATAVQIGDPITQKKLSDAIVREARDLGLYNSITDDGAGGLSCSVAEMAKECGGAEVDLEKVPLKYPGLAPWQIWISESQERMTLAVPKKNWAKLKKLFERHGVEASAIGTFTDSGRCVVRYKGKKIMDMEMEFLHNGRPIEIQKGKKPERTFVEPSEKMRRLPINRVLLDVLARPSIASSAFIAEQYDHEVQGTSVTKPLQGKGRVNAESAVMQPVAGSTRGIVLAHGYAPWYSDIDTHAMAAAAIDTAVRNAIAAGASRDHLAILDNFCWSTSNTPERLYELKKSAEACYEIATAYGTPYISGKDSMFNDFRGYTKKGEKVHLAAPPTLLVSAIGVIPDVGKAVTLDFKMPGDAIYILGETDDELGASEYFHYLSDKHKTRALGKRVPHVDARKNSKTYDALSAAIGAGLLASAVGVGRGGLGVALARSVIGGQIGAQIDLKNLPGDAKKADSILFSESQGRIVVSVRPQAAARFEQLIAKIPHSRLGEVCGTALVVNASTTVKIPVAGLTNAYRKTFRNW
ncbi:phosphoribosylformylglycinamidine synthase [Candidatus Kaiserbacteria bacterium]|nr:phosphoribosylformylglycinamidine synthase [Candidatus Kaiserbacteria bacterium]